MITLSKSARQHILSVVGVGVESVFKLSLSQKGCSGYSYVMEVGPKPASGWVIELCDEVTVALRHEDFNQLAGCHINWVRDGMSSRLEVSNPKAVNACGCGASVMFKPPALN